MSVSEINMLRGQLDECWLGDRHGFAKRLAGLERRITEQKPVDQSLQKITEEMATSIARVQQRRAALVEIEFPEQLPVAQHLDAIVEAISKHQVVVIAGETGSGKTTQIPKICLSLGRGLRGLIGHTQPRRLAARSVAARIADELKTPLGQGVGYQIRFNEVASENTWIQLMTDGILLSELQRDRWLSRYDTLIIDEAHERSLNIDFLLGYLKQLLPRRPDLKLIITSATIDVARFSKHFNDAPVIEVSGRTFPVDVWYRPVEELVASNDDDEQQREMNMPLAIQYAIEELQASEGASGISGDVLVFLPGEREIREVAKQLRDANLPHTEVLPLYARLSQAEQNRIFDLTQRRGRRIVLSTNVAETSLTVPGIRYVIDPGIARISRYSYRSKLQRLPLEPISQASANQRKGRCGRVADGICIRLYSELDFNGRPEFTDPEILRTNLAAVILQMLALGLGDIESFPFVEPPDKRQIGDGFKVLEELGAVTPQRQLTAIGKQLAKIPADPRIARMLLAASQQGALREMLIIASALSVQDPRERPAEKQQQSDEKHRRFAHPESDFLSLVNLWDYAEQQRQELTQNQWRKNCQKEFLSWLRLREWRDVHHQLRVIGEKLGWKENHEPAAFDVVHRSLLAGLLSQIARLEEKGEYLAARNRKLRIFPGSPLYKKDPKWLVAAEIVETSQVFARTVAKIDPDWLLGINDTLFKRSYTEPYFQARSGQVMAYETLSLYGLLIRDRQLVHYGPIDAVDARAVLIRQGLVEQRYLGKAPFYLHNKKLVADIEGLEDKARRRDILADDEALFAFYNERIPADVTTVRRLEQWLKTIEATQPNLLFADRERLMLRSAHDLGEEQFPKKLRWQELNFELRYRFEPGHAEDGVTLIIPVGLLNRVPQQRCEWLVPGMLRDKCIELIKTLPKALRRQFVPVPDTVDKIFPQLDIEKKLQLDESLQQSLSMALKVVAGIDVPLDAWQSHELEPFYRMHFVVLGEKGERLGAGRDLAALREALQEQRRDSLAQVTAKQFADHTTTRWDFGELKQSVQFKQAAVSVTAYPALVDKDDQVAIELQDDAAVAEALSENGLVRLFMLQLSQSLKYIRKELLKGNLLSLQLAGANHDREQWILQLQEAVVRAVFVTGQPLPRTEQDFQQRLKAGENQLIAKAQSLASLLAQIAEQHSAVAIAVNGEIAKLWPEAVADIRQQLNQLFPANFIAATPLQWLEQYPRYLKAIRQRLDKLRSDPNRDRQLTAQLQMLAKPFLKVQADLQGKSLPPLLLQFRWALEEFRVSLFAQNLGTRMPVSEKRLKTLWSESGF